MNMRPIFLPLLALMGILVACEPEMVGPDPYTHRYTETQCADPWVDRYTGSRDDTSEAAMLDYLAAAGISVLNSRKITADTTLITCAACDCPSGAMFEVAVPASDANELEALGFIPINP